MSKNLISFSSKGKFILGLQDLVTYISKHLDYGLTNVLFDLMIREEEQKQKENPNFSIILDEYKKEIIEDFLDYQGIDEKYLNMKKTKKCDFCDDKNPNNHYFCDISSEWADGKVDIRNSDLWATARTFSEYIEESIADFWSADEVVKKRGLIGLFQQWQYYFYDRLANNILEQIKDFIQESYENRENTLLSTMVG